MKFSLSKKSILINLHCLLFLLAMIWGVFGLPKGTQQSMKDKDIRIIEDSIVFGFPKETHQSIRPKVAKTMPYQVERKQTSPILPLPDECSSAIPTNSQIIHGKKGHLIFNPIISKAASIYQVDPALIKAIIMAESGYNTKALSRKGAQGLMQLMPGTAKALGVEDSFNPEQNIHGGVKYFKQLLNQFDGNIKFALAAYNAGSRNVRQYQGVPPFRATHKYISKVYTYYDYYKKQMT